MKNWRRLLIPGLELVSLWLIQIQLLRISDIINIKTLCICHPLFLCLEAWFDRESVRAFMRSVLYNYCILKTAS